MWWWWRRKNNTNVVVEEEEKQYKCGGGGGGGKQQKCGGGGCGGGGKTIEMYSMSGNYNKPSEGSQRHINNAVLTKPLEGTRGGNGFVCRLQGAGYPRPAYFSYPR